MRVAIAGAGIFGLTAALELRRRGHEVVVCDPGPVPHPQAESTDISKVVRMDYADALYLELMEATFDGWHAWNAAWGEALYHEVGFLLLRRAPMTPESFEAQTFARLCQRGHALERLDAGAIASRFPAWGEGGYVDGYFNPRAGYVESGKVVERLAAEARAHGIELRDGDGAARVLEESAGARGLVTRGGETIRADAVLVAAGSWTPLLVPQLGDRLWSTAQTVLHFRVADAQRYVPPQFPVWAAGLGDDGWYGFPAMPDGVLKVANHGVGRPLHPDAERRVLAEDEARFRAFLRGALPELAEAPLLHSRLCLYSDSWDSNFYVAADPDRAGLFVATGGSGHGFKFAPSLGAIIADVVEGTPNRWAERFAWRPRGEGEAVRK